MKPSHCPFRSAEALKSERGRAGEIRTHDLLHPMQAFYQAELRPVGWRREARREVMVRLKA